MLIKNRLDTFSVRLLKNATKVVFVNYIYRTRGIFDAEVTVAIALIFVNEFPVAASCGNGFWEVRDISSASRSIRRHNTDCDVIDRRDIICDSEKMKFSDFIAAQKNQFAA